MKLVIVRAHDGALLADRLFTALAEELERKVVVNTL